MRPNSSYLTFATHRLDSFRALFSRHFFVRQSCPEQLHLLAAATLFSSPIPNPCLTRLEPSEELCSVCKHPILFEHRFRRTTRPYQLKQIHQTNYSPTAALLQFGAHNNTCLRLRRSCPCSRCTFRFRRLYQLPPFYCRIAPKQLQLKFEPSALLSAVPCAVLRSL